MPTRVDGDLFEAAKVSGAAASRSAAQQINHWARIGRELEAAPGVSGRDIARVLAGDGSYDDLSEREQAIVRGSWRVDLVERRDELDLAAEFADAGRRWSDADDDGNIVVKGASDAHRPD